MFRDPNRRDVVPGDVPVETAPANVGMIVAGPRRCLSARVEAS
jgi:hypothetical protein